MAIVIVRGFTFSGSETVTASKLHALIENALISGIGASDLAAGEEIVTISGTAPTTPLVGTVWFDSTNVLFSRWDGSVWKVIEVHVGTSEPTNTKQDGQLWADTTGIPVLNIYDFDNAEWIPVGASAGSGGLPFHQTQILYPPASGTAIGEGDGFLGLFTEFTSGSGATSVESETGIGLRVFTMNSGTGRAGTEGDNEFMLTDSRKTMVVTFQMSFVDVTLLRLFIGLSPAANTVATLLGADDPAVANVMGFHFANGNSANWQYAHKGSGAAGWSFTDSGVAPSNGGNFIIKMEWDEAVNNQCIFTLMDKDEAELNSATITTELPDIAMRAVIGIEAVSGGGSVVQTSNVLFTQEGAA